MNTNIQTHRVRSAGRKWKAWGQLFRPPNLFTVPGDPLAGFLLAAAGVGPVHLSAEFVPVMMLATAGGSLLLYSAGLLENDYCDLAEDRRDRPDRPLPSGRVRPGAALAVSVVLRLIALGLAAWISLAALAAAGGIIVASAVYNRWTKRIVIVGPLNMGLCRGLSVLLGAAAWGAAGVGSPLAAAGAGLVTAYIAAVTAVAASETSGRAVGSRRNLPAAFLAFGLAVLALLTFHAPPTDAGGWSFLILSATAVGWAGRCAVRLGGAPAPGLVQKNVGGLIRGLLLVQAALCALPGGPGMTVAAILLVFWPLSWLAARVFYAS